jgi:hypothetical protein
LDLVETVVLDTFLDQVQEIPEQLAKLLVLDLMQLLPVAAGDLLSQQLIQVLTEPLLQLV